jgi:hypothetical protein
MTPDNAAHQLAAACAPISAVASPGDELHSPAAVAGSATTAAAGTPLDIVASQLCADVRAERAQYTAPRYTTPTCRACRGAGFTRTASTRVECGACNGAGATVERAHGTYEPVVEGVEPELRGRELADLPELRTRLLEWARSLAESVANGTPLSRDEALMLRDELVLHVEALDQHQERVDERELQDDLRDDEMQRLHEHIAEVERERDEMKAALAAEQRMREQDAAELQALADVHGELIVQAVQLRETTRQAQEMIEKLQAELLLRSERGVA